MSKDTTINCLPDNTKFEVVGCEKSYRNLLLIRSNDCGALIRGEMRTSSLKDEEKWTPIGVNYIISCGTRVRVIK
jgi:hypothetical protein